VFSEGYLYPLLNDKRLSGIDCFHLFDSIQFPELRNADIMFPSDLEKVVALFHHIDGLGRFTEILLKSNRFSLGDSDPIVTWGKIKPTDLWVELLYGFEIGLRCLSNSF